MIIMEDTRTVTFHCPEMSSTMLHKLYEQRKANRFCDITLYVNNKVLKAHRNVLASCSPYFDSILKHHKIVKEQLTVSCIDSEIFSTLLHFMYTGEITIRHSNVEELLKLADHFILTKVIEYCIEFLGTKLNIENCLFTFFLTQRFKLKHLGSIVENWISSHIENVCDNEEIGRLSSKELTDFFRNKNFILTTQTALNVLSKWVLVDIERREKYFDKLIRCFYTNNLEPVEVYKHLDTCILYSKSELCLFRFLDYLAQSNWTLSSFKTRYEVLQAKYGQISPDPKTQETDSRLDKIIVSERQDLHNTINVAVKQKLRSKKQILLKKLMLFGLKPSLRVAALKMLTCKKKVLLSSEVPEKEQEIEGNDDPDERVGIKCPICFAIINDSLLLEQHLALSHAKDVTYKCSICSFVCQYHGDYLNHMKTHFNGPPFKCDFCEFNTDQISKLITHRAQHLDESIYQCTFCSFKCRQKHNYISHMKIHTPEKTFKCDQCSKAFRFKQNLDAHALTHSPEKSLTCDSCGFHTKLLSHLVAHKRIHTVSTSTVGDTFRCSYPHCKYTTSKKAQLVSHTKTHAGSGNNSSVRPHACSVCGRGFMEKSHLVRHERIHLEEKPFKCSNCDYASSRRDKLKEHFTRHHGENASAKVPYKARPLRNATATSTRPKSQTSQESTPTTTVTTSSNSGTFSQSNASTSSSSITQPMGSEQIQDLILHHSNHTAPAPAINSTYPHHFGDPAADFHHAAHTHAHNIHNQILASSAAAVVAQGQRSTTSSTHSPTSSTINHHQLLTRSNHSTATSTAAAVAAAMMLDPRFHHNSTVPYPSATPVSMAMAAVQSSQQIQASTSQSGDYPTTLQNCMTLF